MIAVSCNGEQQCGWDTTSLYKQFYTDMIRLAIFQHAVRAEFVRVEFPQDVPPDAWAAV